MPARVRHGLPEARPGGGGRAQGHVARRQGRGGRVGGGDMAIANADKQGRIAEAQQHVHIDLTGPRERQHPAAESMCKLRVQGALRRHSVGFHCLFPLRSFL
ncbi:hypothetical protein D3C71_1958760 [compost metagenome]